MLKKIKLTVPVYLKKYLEVTYEVREVRNNQRHVHVEKWSSLGQLLDFGSRVILLPQKLPDFKGEEITITYYCREKSYDVPTEKLARLVKLIDEEFRRALISYVSALHEKVGGDYGPYVTMFLNRYDIVPDVDVDWETMRKVYRDYLVKVERRNQKIYA